MYHDLPLNTDPFISYPITDMFCEWAPNVTVYCLFNLHLNEVYVVSTSKCQMVRNIETV